MNAELLMEARLRHPAGSRLRRGPAPLPVEVTGARPVLRLLPPMSDPSEPGVGPTHWPADTVDAGDEGDAGPWSGVQLTRRGRGVLFALLLVGIFCGGLAFGSHASGADAGPAPAPPAHAMVVRPGQTLWDIAREVQPGSDPRATVDRIIDMNALRSSQIDAGSRLLLPG